MQCATTVSHADTTAIVELTASPAPGYGTMMDRFVAAVVQLASADDREANLARAESLIRAAAAEGARLIALPEVAAWRGPTAAEPAAVEPIPGPSTRRLAALAASLRVHLCPGSLLEDSGDPARPYNTTCLIGPDGTILARYRKIHLFDVDLPGRVVVRESAQRTPGDGVVVVPTPLGAVGLSICYDLRFPELYRRAVEAGAEILLVPSAFTAPTGAAHWEVLCRARAIESQCWVLAPNQTGRSPHGFDDWGHSMIVDPWGAVVAMVERGEGIGLAEIDRARLAQVRRELPALRHDRLRR
jgi:predicted amidohydrolase